MAGKSKKLTIADLKGAPYNPRDISPEAASGLRFSMESFGDISGIVFNVRTGQLVAGHQRMDQLKTEHGDKLVMEPNNGPDDGKGYVIKTSDGQEWNVRVVDWDELREKAANIAANNPRLQGAFVQDALEEQLAEVRDGLPEVYDGAQMGALSMEDVWDGGLPTELEQVQLQGSHVGDSLLIVLKFEGAEARDKFLETLELDQKRKTFGGEEVLDRIKNLTGPEDED